jgi:thioredoxin 1
MKSAVLSLMLALVPGLGFATELYVFTRPGCGPCEKLKAAIQAEPDLFNGFDVHMIDSSENPQIAGTWRVASVPTIIVVEDGKEVRRRVGFKGSSELRAWLDNQPRRRRLRQ